MTEEKSISSLTSESSNHQSDLQPVYNYPKDVPLEMKNVTEDAVSRQLSRISRVSEVVVPVDSKNDDKYNRFSSRTKKICLLMTGMAGFLSPLNSLGILPAIPEISKAFGTTPEIINVSNAVYCIFMALSPCLFSPCSDIYGRRPMFLICAALYCVSNALVAVSQNLAMFFVFRSATALFGTSFFSIGGHIVGDLYHPNQRGRAISVNILGAQVGTGFGAFLGGLIVNFTSWRVILWVMMGFGAVVLILAIFFLPETSVQTKHSIILEQVQLTHPKRKFVFVPFNALRIMIALKYPFLSINGFIAIATIYTMFMLQTPITEVLEPRFGLTKPIYSGLFYLAPGIGYLVGSLIGGPYSDRTVKKYTEIKGRRIPEDRLRALLLPLGVLYPISTIVYGFCVQYEKGGMAVPIIFLFLGGVAQTCIFPASNAYSIDASPELGGDGIASSYFSRYIAAAIASATCLRSINSIGLGWTCTIAAVVLWVAFAGAIVLIFYGEKSRIDSLVKNGLRVA